MINGYNIITGGEGLDPEEWYVTVDQVDKESGNLL